MPKRENIAGKEEERKERKQVFPSTQMMSLMAPIWHNFASDHFHASVCLRRAMFIFPPSSETLGSTRVHLMRNISLMNR